MFTDLGSLVANLFVLYMTLAIQLAIQEAQELHMNSKYGMMWNEFGFVGLLFDS